MAVTNFPNRISQAGTVTEVGTAQAVGGSVTVTPAALTAVAGFVPGLLKTPGTAALSVGGSVVGGTAFVIQVRDNAGAAAAGTVPVSYVAFGTV